MKTLTLTIEYEEPITEDKLVVILDGALGAWQPVYPELFGWRYNPDTDGVNYKDVVDAILEANDKADYDECFADDVYRILHGHGLRVLDIYKEEENNELR